MTNLLDEVPKQAESAIRHAIKVSKRGRNTALDRLEKIKRGEIPRGRPEGVGKPEEDELGPSDEPGPPDEAGPPGKRR